MIHKVGCGRETGGNKIMKTPKVNPIVYYYQLSKVIFLLEHCF